MKIISWNVLHTKGAGLAEVCALIAQHSPDLLLMQEATEAIDNLPKTIGGYYERIVLPGRLHGLAAWSARSWQSPSFSLVLQRGVIVKRVAQILSLADMTVANVHLSHGQFLNRFQLGQIAKALSHRAAILGDCNMIGVSMLRDFTDVGPRLSTHRSAKLVPLRLDRCFIRGLRCVSARALDYNLSDHKPIMVELL